jgi:endonuclease/exonuclease/phosphatase family metal-dependent hydrolase
VRAGLRTCCWHAAGHQYGSLTETGDYVLAARVLATRVPRVFEATRGTAVASDHLPVEAIVEV